ncbi:MAG: hypothetical protein DRO00_08145 [Thermoproteota archaeon]|nr:MAG: hypothetical protein DRO00_08145 [Candidatus Korarchaeota archaeon]
MPEIKGGAEINPVKDRVDVATPQLPKLRAEPNAGEPRPAVSTVMMVAAAIAVTAISSFLCLEHQFFAELKPLFKVLKAWLSLFPDPSSFSWEISLSLSSK